MQEKTLNLKKLKRIFKSCLVLVYILEHTYVEDAHVNLNSFNDVHSFLLVNLANFNDFV